MIILNSRFSISRESKKRFNSFLKHISNDETTKKVDEAVVRADVVRNALHSLTDCSYDYNSIQVFFFVHKLSVDFDIFKNNYRSLSFVRLRWIRFRLQSMS